MSTRTRFDLGEKQIPTRWYNIAADLPAPPKPPLHPKTGQPLAPADLLRIFPENLVQQEASTERWIDVKSVPAVGKSLADGQGEDALFHGPFPGMV